MNYPGMEVVSNLESVRVGEGEAREESECFQIKTLIKFTFTNLL